MATVLPIASALIGAAAATTSTIAQIEARQSRVAQSQQASTQRQQEQRERLLANTEQKRQTLSRTRAQLMDQGLVPVGGSSAARYLQRIAERFDNERRAISGAAGSRTSNSSPSSTSLANVGAGLDLAQTGVRLATRLTKIE